MNFKAFLLLITIGFYSCSDSNSESKKDGKYTDNAETLFTKITAENSSISFENKINQTNDFNFMNYMYIYTGAGVAVGDIDNDGFEDIYFVSNFGPNKLYKNKGNFSFEDITTVSKTEDYTGFSSGATMLDVNNDGWLDIYISKAGALSDNDARRNLLFVNQKDGTFKEAAKNWGIDDPGYTTQTYTIDYDKDGDLDLYIVNHRYDFQNNGTINTKLQRQIEEITSDQLYRNDTNKFTKVTGEAGLYNKTWGLSASVGDFNNDGWDDIYIANDFMEPDMLYINQKNGSFKDEILKSLDHITTFSMGSDYADLNNDLLPDLITLDMAASSHKRSKENMASMSTSNFMKMVEIGYHHAYMSNMLHYNTGNGKYKETALLSGIAKTDWSWSALIADYDNDGLKDIFITNGVDKDYTNQDARIELKKVMQSGKAMLLDDVLNTFPFEKMSNYIFKNNGDLKFVEKIKEWGLEDPNFSYGSAYADLDNDGDLDLITNNIDDKAGIYKNNANNNYLKIKLKGNSKNPFAIGSKVILKNGLGTSFKRIVLVNFFNPPPLYRKLFTALPSLEEVFTNTIDNETKPQVKLKTKLAFQSQDSEANHCALWIKQILTKNPNAHIGILAADKPHSREKLELALKDVLTPSNFFPNVIHESLFNTSGNTENLLDSGLIYDAFLILNLGADQYDTVDIIRLLQSPFINLDRT